MTSSPRPSANSAWILASTLAALLSSCSDEPPPPPANLIVVDGMTIPLAEVEPYVRFFDSYMPEGGHKAKVQRAFEEHVLPLHLARRAFPEQRRVQLERALALRAVATNVVELEEQSKLLDEKTRKIVTRLQPKLPVAMFLFDPLLTGAVSEPIEVPFGYVVAGCYEIIESAIVLDDRADAMQVGFSTHPSSDWHDWLKIELARIATKVTWVHPDYREAIPSWMTLP